jgi:hypothetical protein
MDVSVATEVDTEQVRDAVGRPVHAVVVIDNREEQSDERVVARRRGNCRELRLLVREGTGDARPSLRTPFSLRGSPSLD